MPRRCDFVDLPDYFVGPTRRPSWNDPAGNYWWDVTSGHWPTTAEWLAWVRRRDGRKRLYSRGVWHYPLRPIIDADFLPSSTRKVRRLP